MATIIPFNMSALLGIIAIAIFSIENYKIMWIIVQEIIYEIRIY